ncbi:PHB depolymerase family esterase [Pseudomonas sp. NPDC007930]|uniref:alpha/beta hydrolase family esterase n=1 Tax=Pseudomonas sp. NPDC007930 TaxID=3364417 RepID=UPI0036E0AF40
MLFLIPTFAMIVLCALAAAWFILPGKPRQVPLGGQFTEAEMGARRYLEYRPANLQAGAGILLVLHGGRQNPQKIRRASGYRFEQLADERGFLLVYPEAYQGHWNDARKQLDVPARRAQVDDCAFLAQLIERLVQAHGADPKRVMLFGYASGGQMALRMALEKPDKLAGIAAVAANLPVPANDIAQHRRRMVPALLVHGTVDPISPFEGGQESVFGFAGRGEVLSARATAAYFGELAQARGESPEPLPNPGGARSEVIVHRWVVAAGARVALYELRGGGHVLPQPNGRAPRVLGVKAKGFDVTTVACDFFGL